MKKLSKLPYGAAELKNQINSSTMKGFILSLMFFMVFGLAVSSLQNIIKKNESPNIKDIPITIVSTFEIEKSNSQINNGDKGSNSVVSSTEEISRNQKFTEELDLIVNNAALFDVNVNTDEIINNIGNAFGLGNEKDNSNGGTSIVNTKNINTEQQVDITNKFVHQDLQKLPSMDYESIKSLVQYPHQARALNLSGTVHIAALIDKSGKLAKSYIYSSTNSLFDEEALNAVRNYNDFSPAVHNERTVDCWIIIPIKFKLK